MTSKESLEVYRAALLEYEKSWKLDDRSEYEKRLEEAFKAIIPEVGMPCTVVYWSDFRAATIVRVETPNRVVIRFNETKCLDYYAGDYEILPEFDCLGEEVFTKRRNGRWVKQGHKFKDGVKLHLHYQRHYIDPTF